jgi:hypothetical protein
MPDREKSSTQKTENNNDNANNVSSGFHSASWLLVGPSFACFAGVGIKRACDGD